MSQIELARKSGVNHVSISRYELGKIAPTVRNLARIADALNVTLNDISLSDGPDSVAV